MHFSEILCLSVVSCYLWLVQSCRLNQIFWTGRWILNKYQSYKNQMFRFNRGRLNQLRNLLAIGEALGCLSSDDFLNFSGSPSQGVLQVSCSVSFSVFSWGTVSHSLYPSPPYDDVILIENNCLPRRDCPLRLFEHNTHLV